MRIEYYDRKSDIMYIRFNDKPFAYGVEYGDRRHVDYDEGDSPIGVELLGFSQGVDIEGLPLRDEIERLISRKRVREYA